MSSLGMLDTCKHFQIAKLRFHLNEHQVEIPSVLEQDGPEDLLHQLCLLGFHPDRLLRGKLQPAAVQKVWLFSERDRTTR
jgi:hypothetical protein